jgi:hypothetical protein
MYGNFAWQSPFAKKVNVLWIHTANKYSGIWVILEKTLDIYAVLKLRLDWNFFWIICKIHQRFISHNCLDKCIDLKTFNPIPTGTGLNQPLYSYHVTQAGRNRVNKPSYTCAVEMYKFLLFWYDTFWWKDNIQRNIDGSYLTFSVVD